MLKLGKNTINYEYRWCVRLRLRTLRLFQFIPSVLGYNKI